MARKGEGSVYRRLNALAREAGWCHLCGRPIDQSLPPEHPASSTADHLVPVALGGAVLGEMYAAHVR